MARANRPDPWPGDPAAVDSPNLETTIHRYDPWPTIDAGRFSSHLKKYIRPSSKLLP